MTDAQRARDKMIAAMRAREARQTARRVEDMATPISSDNKGFAMLSKMGFDLV